MIRESRFIGNSLQDLSNAIILQAVKDYRTALSGARCWDTCKSPKSMIEECERFFRSTWFSQLSKLDGEYLIEQIRKEFDNG